MTRMIKKMLAVLATMTLCGAFAEAVSHRIAVVDLERVFKEYYKSRIAEEEIRRQGEIYRGYLMELNNQLSRLTADEHTARMDAQNIALDSDAQQKAQRKAEDLERKVKAKRSEIELYAQSRREAIGDLEKRKRAEIIADITSEIRKRAAAEGYAFVLDSSGRTTNDQPAVLLAPPDADLTQQVLRELNRTSTAAPDASSAPAKSDGK